MTWIASFPVWMLTFLFLFFGSVGIVLMFDKERRDECGGPLALLLFIVVALSLSSGFAKLAIWIAA
jgi:hypothetical protein